MVNSVDMMKTCEEVVSMEGDVGNQKYAGQAD